MEHQQFLDLVLIYVLGFMGWQLFKYFKIPVASILGPMVFVGFFQVLGNHTLNLPSFIIPMLHSIIGTSIGTKITEEIYNHLKQMVISVIVVSLWWLIVSLFTGYIFYKLGFFDIKTAFLGTASGGLSEMSLISLSVNANSSQVAFLQAFRLFGIVMSLPFACRLFPKKEGQIKFALSHNDKKSIESYSFCLLKKQLYTLALGFVFGIILYLAGFPAGGLIGALLVVGLAKLLGRIETAVPISLIYFAQIGLGGTIGSNMNVDTIQMLKAIFWPAVCLTLVMLVSGFVLAIIVFKTTNFNIQTCLLSTCAGGLTQLAVMSDELGADSLTVTLMQLVRLLTILMLLPFLFILFGIL